MPSGPTCTTGSAGTCAVNSGNIPATQSTASFTVDNVTLAGFSYTPSANRDPDTDSNGTTITIAK